MEIVTYITELQKVFQENANLQKAAQQKAYLKNNNAHVVFLETAHPIKFLDVVESVIDKKVTLPEDIKSLILKEKKSILIKDYEEFKAYMMHS